MADVKTLVQEWAINKGIHHPDRADKQFLKLVEEVGELAAGMARNDSDMIKDAIGDIQVVLIILSMQLGINYDGALSMVYDIISKRTGKTVNGVFIKDEPLSVSKDPEEFENLGLI